MPALIITLIKMNKIKYFHENHNDHHVDDAINSLQYNQYAQHA